jgi:hypothetical protein
MAIEVPSVNLTATTATNCNKKQPFDLYTNTNQRVVFFFKNS